MEELEQGKKRHRIFDHKVLSSILPFVIFFVASNVAVIPLVVMGMGTDAPTLNFATSVLSIIISLVMAVIFLAIFRDEFDGFFGWTTAGLALVAPTVSLVLINLLDTDFSHINPLFYALILSLSPGLSEELLFRAIPSGNWMRVSGEERDILPTVIVSSLIFGLFHGLNALVGAALSSTLFQIFYAFCLGFAFDAVYLRTGSILPTVIVHTLIDLSYMLFADPNAGALITEELTIDFGFWFTVALSIGFVVWGLYLIRAEKRPEIVKLWDRKWSRNRQTGPTAYEAFMAEE